MKRKKTNILLSFLNGEMPPEESQAFQQKLEQSPELRTELEEMRTLQATLRTSVRTHSTEALRPFFADRLMRRINARCAVHNTFSPEEEFFRNLAKLFRPIAIASVIIILSLATYNFALSTAYEVSPSPTEAVLGLPPVDLATAYDLDFYQSRSE